MKDVSDKAGKLFCADLKSIYHAPNEDKALEALPRVAGKWNGKYPGSGSRAGMRFYLSGSFLRLSGRSSMRPMRSELLQKNA